MSKLIKVFKWEKMRNNYILRLDEDHFISYNPSTKASHFSGLFDGLIGSEDESGEETALLDKANPEHEYRILTGDWRDDYEKLAPKGFEACLDFFMEKRKEHGGQWSSHEKDRAQS